MADHIWTSEEQSTILDLFERRLAADPDGEYLDIGGVKLTARDVMQSAGRFGGALAALGTEQHDRVATLIESSPSALLSWAGTTCSGRISVPINTAYKGDYLSHQLIDSGSRVLVVAASLFPAWRPSSMGFPHSSTSWWWTTPATKMERRSPRPTRRPGWAE